MLLLCVLTLFAEGGAQNKQGGRQRFKTGWADGAAPVRGPMAATTPSRTHAATAHGTASIRRTAAKTEL